MLPHGHKVEYAPKVDSQQILSFCMGKNTPDRQEFIIEHLRIDVDRQVA